MQAESGTCPSDGQVSWCVQKGYFCAPSDFEGTNPPCPPGSSEVVGGECTDPCDPEAPPRACCEYSPEGGLPDSALEGGGDAPGDGDTPIDATDG